MAWCATAFMASDIHVRTPSPPGAAVPWYAPIVEFGTHVFVGATIFLVIAAAAWVIDAATSVLGRDSVMLRYGLTAVEVTLFSADVLLFLVFIARTTWRTLRKLMLA
jgi:hypothetical protein